MPVICRSHSFTGSLTTQLTAPPPEAGVDVYWLGQAGFVLRSRRHCMVIDPYLSDYLAHKYQGRPLPHQRMMAAPIAADALGMTSLVMVTHHHSDHMDPDTLRPLLAAAPNASIVVPRASRDLAVQRSGLPEASLCTLDAGEQIEPLSGVALTATRASHETLERDAQGNHRFLGYVIETEGLRIFHSGDTIPFAGQVEELRALNIDLALLPVNGRSAELSAQGVPGNLTLEEAFQLCQQCDIRYMIAHHYGLFDFNSADPHDIDRCASQTASPTILRATLQTQYHIQDEPCGSGID